MLAGGKTCRKANKESQNHPQSTTRRQPARAGTQAPVLLRKPTCGFPCSSLAGPSLMSSQRKSPCGPQASPGDLLSLICPEGIGRSRNLGPFWRERESESEKSIWDETSLGSLSHSANIPGAQGISGGVQTPDTHLCPWGLHYTVKETRQTPTHTQILRLNELIAIKCLQYYLEHTVI